jgi:N-carbamoylputrescine amidase
MKNLTVALIQQQVSADRQANLDNIISNIETVAKQGAQLVILQELHNGFYFPQQEDTAYFDWAEPIPGPTTQALSAVAKRTGTVIVSSLFEFRAAGIYHNTAVVLEKDGTIAGIYRKMHIPDDPGFYEKYYFTPGDLGFKPIQTSVGKLGVQVCWDQWYPEGARLMALAGAELLIYPTAIGWHPTDTQDEKQRQLDAWITIQRAHAVANGIPVLVSNRVGYEYDPKYPESTEEGIQFWGNSFVAGVQGEILAQGNPSQPENLLVTLDMTRSRKVRPMWPYFRDRRIDSYADITARYLD